MTDIIRAGEVVKGVGGEVLWVGNDVGEWDSRVGMFWKDTCDTSPLPPPLFLMMFSDWK